ncbi:MAG: NosD domain-containing protein [Gemmatimonadaceae bacterium]
MSTIWNRINTLLLLLVLAAVIGGFATRAWGGALDPPAAPGPTQPQVEPRSPIPPVGWNGTFPITISQPGSYFLTRNLTNATSSDGIDITTHDVSLDLNGFTLTGFGGGSGIRAGSPGARGISVRNGAVELWSTGVDLSQSAGAVADSLRVTDDGQVGLNMGAGGLAHDITAQRDNIGIEVSDPASTFGGGLIDGCVATKNNWGVYLLANNVTVKSCDLDSNTQSGLQVAQSFFFDTITDNTAQGDPIGVHLEAGTSGNTVVRNVFALNTTAAVADTGSPNNRVGPIATVSTAGPWDNIGG